MGVNGSAMSRAVFEKKMLAELERQEKAREGRIAAVKRMDPKRRAPTNDLSYGQHQINTGPATLFRVGDTVNVYQRDIKACPFQRPQKTDLKIQKIMGSINGRWRTVETKLGLSDGSEVDERCCKRTSMRRNLAATSFRWLAPLAATETCTTT